MCLFVTGETVVERPGQLHSHCEEGKAVKVIMTDVGDGFGRVGVEVLGKVGSPPVEG